MAGNQTNGFDMVIEVSATTIQNLLSAAFDSDGLLGKLFPSSYVLDSFSLSVSFNRPSDAPSSSQNPIELLFELNFRGGITGQLRVVAEVNVDRSRDNLDLVQIDFKNGLHVCQVLINGASLSIVNNYVSNKLKELSIPLIPVPVQRTSNNPMNARRADVKIIDDTTVTNNDALGVMLTYGGGTAGNLNAFTTAFAREGAGAAVAIKFGWICRNISPKIEEALGMSAGAFNNCSFRGNHEVSDGVSITELDITPTDDSIRLSGKVQKSGFCYTASGKIGANIFVGIVAGELRVRFETDDPEINVNIPWYCYVAGAIVGAALGGIILGVVGSIVGGVLIPLILYIAQSVVESTVQNIADRVTSAIGTGDLSVNLPGISTILDTAFIDDLTVTYNMYPDEYAEVKSEGELTVKNGQFFDLDNGIIKDSSFSGADLRLIGSGQSRRLRAQCGTSLAIGNMPAFQWVRRFHLYGLTYGLLDLIPFDQIGVYYTIPWHGSFYIPTNKVFAAKTSDGCYSVFQVTAITSSQFKIRYRTYQLESFTVRISGFFSCFPYLAGFDDFRIERSEYIDSFVLNKALADKIQLSVSNQQQFQLEEIQDMKKSFQRTQPTMMSHAKSSEPAMMSHAKMLEPMMFHREIDTLQLKQLSNIILMEHNRPVGKWIDILVPVRKTKTGNFRAIVDGAVEVTSLTWMVDGNPLKPESEGKIKVKGENFDYKTHGTFLTLSSSSGKELDVPIRVTVVTNQGSVMNELRCVPYKNDCGFKTQGIPLFKEYLDKFQVEYGVVKVPQKTANTLKMVLNP
jgi:hypothetical protein